MSKLHMLDDNIINQRINEEYRLVIPLDLQLFAKEGPGGEKTEEATGKKLEDVRKEGNVAKSREIPTAATLLSLYICLKYFLGFVGSRLISSFRYYYAYFDKYTREGFDRVSNWQLFVHIIFDLVVITAPFMLLGLAVAFFSNSLQFKWMVTLKPLEPKFSKMNPISGFKRFFSLNTFMELIKSLAKVIACAFIAYSVLKSHSEDLFILYDITLNQGLVLMYNIILELLLKISIVFVFIAVVDYAFQRWKFKDDNKMTKQEVKDEYKNQEGDPTIRGQQKQRMREASQRRMMAAVPEADVVITNPTHFAVALSYTPGSNQAPIVVAKGADLIAKRIKEVAAENSVEIVENKQLARMLYYNVDVDAEIPVELYQAVADIFAYVYRLKNKLA